MLPSSWINDALVRVRREKDTSEAAEAPHDAAKTESLQSLERRPSLGADSRLIARLAPFRREEPADAEPDIPEERWTGQGTVHALAVAQGPTFAG